MTEKIITGNQAVAHGVRLSRTQVVSAYPITPQTTVMETLAEMWASGDFKGEFVSVESEYSALGYCVGAAYAGARAFTGTSSHGLAYMHELIHWAAGARLPLVMSNANRAMGAPWCIESDQIDSLSQRDTGWLQFYCSSVQEVLDTTIMAFRLAETARLPVMVNYDGFYLSHTYEAAAIPEQRDVDLFLPPPPDRPAFDLENPENRHGLVGSEAMHRLLNVRYQATEAVHGIYEEINHQFNKHMGRSWPVVEYFGPEGAPTVLVTAGAMAQTVKSFLAEPGRGEALLKIRMFRPFPADTVRKVLGAPHIKKIVVIDRNVSMGVGGVFAQEVKAALQELPGSPQVVELNVSGGLDLTPDIIARALETEPQVGEKISWAVNLI